MPAALHDLIFQMLEKDPNKRPQSLDKVVEALETLLAHLRVGATLPNATAPGLPSIATPHASSPVRVTAAGLTVAPPTLPEPAAPIAAQEDTPPPPKSKLPFIVAGVLLLIIGAGAVVAFKPAPAPEVPVVVAPIVLDEPKKVEMVEKVEPPPVAPKLVKLTIETKPDGAEVFEKDVSLGMTPLVLSREAQAIVELRFVLKGYQDLSKKLAVPLADESRTIELEKKRAGGDKPKTGGSGLKDLDFEQANDLKDLE
jgi:hypothetical protein